MTEARWFRHFNYYCKKHLSIILYAYLSWFCWLATLLSFSSVSIRLLSSVVISFISANLYEVESHKYMQRSQKIICCVYHIYSAISRAIFTQIKAKVQWNLSPRGDLGLQQRVKKSFSVHCNSTKWGCSLLISWANSPGKERIDRGY